MLIVDEDKKKVLDLFQHRCILCGTWTNMVHEIHPRSSGKGAMAIENRVPLCSEHHNWAHSVGTKKSVPILQKRRTEILANGITSNTN